jgi:hypothetical protein
MQAFCGIKLSFSVTRLKGHFIEARFSVTDYLEGGTIFLCVRMVDDNLSIIPFFFHVTAIRNLEYL